MDFEDKAILITGGTGSFGRALAKRLLEEDKVKKVIIFSRDEWKQWEMRQQDPIFSSPKVRFFLGDVRDKNRLQRAFNEVDIVIHAAALKQVPAAEYNPTEFVQTNILGAQNIIEAAIDAKVKKVIALSSDKAVNPVNLYGATKLCSDKLFIAGNSYVGERGYPIFSVVRYGNVIASRGSLIPRWQQLLQEGAKELPLTDPRMTRFFLTLDQSLDFVTECTKIAEGGEIFVPKVPSMAVTELAEAMAPGIALKTVGIRPGEKLHETLISQEDARNSLDCGSCYIITPIMGKKHTHKGKALAEDFSYTSDNNSEWLKKQEIKTLLDL